MRARLLIALGLLGGTLAGCDPLPDMFAVRNATTDELTVDMQVSLKLGSEDCDSHDGQVVFEVSGTAPISPGRERCFSPDGPGDTEDARLHVVSFRVTRNGTTCIDDTGDQFRQRPFIDERYSDALIIDDAVCP